MGMKRIKTDGDRRAALKETEALAKKETTAEYAARRLAELGGSDPTATAPPRRRFW